MATYRLNQAEPRRPDDRRLPVDSKRAGVHRRGLSQISEMPRCGAVQRLLPRLGLGVSVRFRRVSARKRTGRNPEEFRAP